MEKKVKNKTIHVYHILNGRIDKNSHVKSPEFV